MLPVPGVAAGTLAAARATALTQIPLRSPRPRARAPAGAIGAARRLGIFEFRRICCLPLLFLLVGCCAAADRDQTAAADTEAADALPQGRPAAAAAGTFRPPAVAIRSRSSFPDLVLCCAVWVCPPTTTYQSGRICVRRAASGCIQPAGDVLAAAALAEHRAAGPGLASPPCQPAPAPASSVL